MGQGRRHFTDEFKQEAIALLVSSGRPLSQTQASWAFRPGPAAEISRLRRENDRLRMERATY
jgi:transposase-like protein